MRTNFAWAASAALIAATASAAPFTFRTAIDQVDSNSLTQVNQVVAQQNGDVAAIVEYDGTSSIAFRPGSGGPLTLIATAGDPIYGISPATSPTFNGIPPFTNLALSLNLGTERATFVGHPGIGVEAKSASAGVYQYQLTGGPGTRILSTGDTAPDTGTFAYVAPGPTTDTTGLGLQVNNAGHALFAGTSQVPLATNQVIVRGSTVGNQSVATGINTGFNTALSKKAITETDRAVFLATSGPGYQIVDDVPGNVRVAAGADSGFGLVTPVQLFAATDTTDLFTATVTGSVGGTFDSSLVFHQKGIVDSYTDLAHWTHTIGSDNNGAAEMTVGNRMAYIVPSTSGSTLGYFDANTNINYTIATDNDTSHSGYTIDTLGNGTDTFAPMVNDHGWVVFEASITKDSTMGLAVLAWDPLSQQVQIVASAGDALNFELGDAFAADNTVAALDPIRGANNKGFDADVLKDGLSDDDHLAFAVNLITEGGANTADVVVVTQLVAAVPEPSALFLMPVAALALLRRNRRQ